MKAAVFNQPGQAMHIGNVPDPIAGPGQVVLKVARCGICGTDLHLTEGKGHTAAAGSILGHEFSGEVAILGPGVDTLQPGDRVCALPFGGCGECPDCRRGQSHWCGKFVFRGSAFAEYVLADAASCLKLPDAVSFEDGALVEPLAVALHGVNLAQIKPGARVAVLGAGPIGLATVYWLRHFGIERIAVGAASTRRAELATRLGASSFFVNDETAVDCVRAQLDGAPDVVIECAGMPGAIDAAMRLAKVRGTVVIPGWCSQTDHFLPMVGLQKELRLLFALLYSVDEFQYVIDTLASGKSDTHRALITGTVDLPEFPAIFESLRGRSPHCKVMLAPWA